MEIDNCSYARFLEAGFELQSEPCVALKQAPMKNTRLMQVFVVANCNSLSSDALRPKNTFTHWLTL